MGRRLTTTPPHAGTDMAELGQLLRARRKALRLTMDDVAEKAGLSRVTLYRVEKGEPSVNAGALVRVARVLGTRIALNETRGVDLPPVIRLSDYPGLSQLAWQLAPDTELSPEETWSLLSRTWHHVDHSVITPTDTSLIAQLEQTFGALPDVSTTPPPTHPDGAQRPRR